VYSKIYEVPLYGIIVLKVLGLKNLYVVEIEHVSTKKDIWH